MLRSLLTFVLLHAKVVNYIIATTGDCIIEAIDEG
jgi:hypothetical protein